MLYRPSRRQDASSKFTISEMVVLSDAKCKFLFKLKYLKVEAILGGDCV